MSEEILLKKILVPIDGSDSSFKAAKYAIKLAKMSEAEIICMHAVVNPPYVEYKTAGLVNVRYVEEAKKHAETWYDKIREMAAEKGVKIASADTILDVASVADSIVNYASREKADLIVIGTKGRTGIKKFLLGSVASGVVTHSHCPVLVTR
jgi:nucleotide-binding universal stress UspA family protein